jgi:hypothetical protein
VLQLQFKLSLIFVSCPFFLPKNKMKNTNRRRLPLSRKTKTPQSTDAVVPPPMSPTSRRILKAQQRLAQDAAFDELMLLRGLNGGKKTHGDIKKIVEKYQERGHYVERSHLEYRMELRAKGLSMVSIVPPPTDTVTLSETVVSELSESTVASISTSDDLLESVVVANEVVNYAVNEVSLNDTTDNEIDEQRKGGRKKGMTNKHKQNLLIAYKTALTEASSICSSVKKDHQTRNKKLPHGTFKNIINKTEEKFGLEAGAINFQTIKSRVLSNNLTGVCYQKV